MELFGRDDVLAQVAAESGRVLILLGEPGVGKSALLQAAQRLPTNAHDVAVEPSTVRRSPAALQLALLDTFGSAVAVLARDEGRARVIARHLTDAAKRMAHARLDQFGAAVGASLLGIVRAKLGGTVADAIKDYAHDLSQSVDERLQARISSASDGDVLDTLVGFATEICQLAQERRVVVALDNVERLTEDDTRRLADMISELPQAVQLRVAFASSAPEAVSRIDMLRSAGAAIVRVQGLDAASVAVWLANAQCPESALHQVMRVTWGYPLHVQDAIAALKAGENLDDLQPGDVAGQWTERAWQACGVEAREAALLLAAFVDPLPHERISIYLGIEPTRWAVVERELWDKHVFVVEVGGARWFHELRRRYLWDRIPTDPQRADLADRAVAELDERMRQFGVQPDLLVEFARLAPVAARTLAQEPDTIAIAQATPDEVGVAAAIMELVEAEHDSPVVKADAALDFAREIFGVRGDVIGALGTLADKSLVRVVSNDYAAVAFPTWTGEHAGLLVAARATRELGRTPVPGLATALFDRYVRPGTQGFSLAHYGIGRPSVTHLCKIAAEPIKDADGRIMIGRRDPALVLWIDYGSVPVYASISFADSLARDAAVDALSALDAEEHGVPLAPRLVCSYPLRRVASRRLSRSLERVTGRSVSAIIPTSESPLSMDEWIERQAAALNFAYEISTFEEQLAYDLHEPAGLLFATERDAYLTAEVHNFSGALQVANVPLHDLANGPLHRLRLGQAAQLAPGQRVGFMMAGASESGYHLRKDPVALVFQRLTQRAEAFNRYQDRAPVVLDQATLDAALTQSLEREIADATRLAQIMNAGKTAPPNASGEVRYVHVLSDQPSNGRPLGMETHVISARRPSRDGSSRVHVICTSAGTTPQPQPLADIGQYFSEVFSLNEDEAKGLIGLRRGDADAVLGGMLGYNIGDVTLQPAQS